MFEIEAANLRTAAESALAFNGLHWLTHESERSLNEATGLLDADTISIKINLVD